MNFLEELQMILSPLNGIFGLYFKFRELRIKEYEITLEHEEHLIEYEVALVKLQNIRSKIELKNNYLRIVNNAIVCFMNELEKADYSKLERLALINRIDQYVLLANEAIQDENIMMLEEISLDQLS